MGKRKGKKKNQIDRLLPDRRTMLSIPLASILIVISGILAYLNTFQAPLIFSDLNNILDNPTIRDLRNVGEILQPPAGSGVANRPIINISLALNYAISGTKAWSYHALNLAIHMTAAWTLFGIVRRVILSEKLKEKYGHDATILALGVSLLWMLHPIQTQAVTYVIQRCESLMGLFFLLVFYCAIRGWQSSRSGGWHLLAVLAFLLGAGSKEVIAVAPLLLLLCELIFFHPTLREVLHHSWRLYTGLLLGELLLSVLVLNGLPAYTISTVPFTLQEYWQTQPQVILHYLRLVLWPDTLCFDYGWPVAGFREALPSIVILVASLIGVVWIFIKNRPWGFLPLWFLIILAPTSIVPLNDPAFEHRMYLSLAALSFAAVVLLYEAGIIVQARFFPSVSNRLLFGITLLLVSLLLGALTYARNQVYRDGLIWYDTVQKAPRNSRAHMNLGVELDQAGRPYEAMKHFQEAIRLKPNYSEAYTNQGNILTRLGKTDDAIRYLREAIRLKADNAVAYSNLGVALGRSGRLHEAMAQFEQALRLKPGYAEAHSNLGLALGRLGRKQEAIGHLQEALRLNPDYQAARMNLELLVKMDGR